jgi:hypothetical protein
MKRRRREERREGINERIRARAAEREAPLSGTVAEVCMPASDLLDRLRYGDCAGFGAPQARVARERMGWRE